MHLTYAYIHHTPMICSSGNWPTPPVRWRWRWRKEPTAKAEDLEITSFEGTEIDSKIRDQEILPHIHIYICIFTYLHIYIYIIIFQIMILKELICSCYRLAGAANLRHLELQLAPSLKSRTTKAWGNELGPPVVYAIHGQHVRQGVAIAMDQ